MVGEEGVGERAEERDAGCPLPSRETRTWAAP
jgi:hypothetical protein